MRSWVIGLAAGYMALLFVAVTAQAQSSLSALPENARPRTYGNGWECVRGYRAMEGRCVAVVVPANAHLDTRGTSWRCNRGYLNDNGRCTPVRVPQNGYAVDSSYDQGWRCNRGYRAVGESCVKGELPANAYLLDSIHGFGWQCERGFRKQGEGYVAVRVPANAFIGYAGDDGRVKRDFAGKRQHALLCPGVDRA